MHVERDAKLAKFWLSPVRLQESKGFSAKELGRIQELIEECQEQLLEACGMSSSQAEVSVARATNVTIDGVTLTVELEDGRTVSAPLGWYPRLAHGSERERGTWRLIGAGEGIHWPDLDEDVSVEGLLAGRRSAESQASLSRWLASRRQAV